MTATIPISQIVTVNPAVLSAAGSAVDLNGLILSNATTVPIGTVASFATAADVSAYFGSGSTEYSMAQVYFNEYTNATKLPGLLYFTQYNTSNVGAYLRGGRLGLTLAGLQALSGTLSVVIDGVTKSGSVNLSAATSFSNAASIIATAITATVSYNSTFDAFVISSGTTGASSTIAFATGTISTAIKLTSATGAVTSQGAVAATQTAFMDALVLQTQNWALFTTTFEPVTADKEAFSNWAAAQNNRYGYVGWDTDINATSAGNTTTWGYYLQSNQITASVPVYGTSNYAAFVLGYAASLDFDRLNGRATLAFKHSSLLTTYVNNATVASALLTNGYNFYGLYANAKDNFAFLYNGTVSGEFAWLDSFLDQIWLNANLQGSMINLLMNVGSIPYNTQGYGLVEAACLDPINAAVNFGAIRTGVTLSDSQKAQIQFALGKDVSQSINAKGYYLQITPANAAIRIARTSPSMTLYYTDGGSIQKLTLASIEIQ